MDSPFSEILSIQEEEAEIRIDKLLKMRFPDFSRTYFQYLIDQESVLLNGASIKKREKCKAGDEIELFFLHSPEITLKPQNIPLDILYEDDAVICVNKPAGMVVHPAVGHFQDTVVNALLYHVKDLPNQEGLRPGIVHRLDKDTSGVLIAAKTPHAHRFLVEAFSKREIKKEYLAICLNRPREGLLEAPIVRDPKERKRMAIGEKGKPASTEFRLLGVKHFFSLVLAKPITGRTHQIRAHLKHLGSPILGDDLYGSSTVNKEHQVTRQLLHAHKILFPHPISGQFIEVTAPIPEDLLQWMSKFGK